MTDRDADMAATELLHRLGSGDATAAEDLLPIVYEQLRALAGKYFRQARVDHTLQPTALVHEAYIKLIRSDTEWESRGHFCAVAATAMRQILIDYARAKRAAKRDARRVDISLADAAGSEGAPALDLIALDDALAKLDGLNKEYARLVELRFFGGLSVEEIASLQGVTSRSIRSRWRATRAWISRELSVEASE